MTRHAVRACAPALEGVEPYDPKYLQADVMLSANESPVDVPASVRAEVERVVARIPLNRYPDPLACGLAELIADAEGAGVAPDMVMVGNGGDELLFNLALAYGGPGRACLLAPPTFSVYAGNARLLGTRVELVPRDGNLALRPRALAERLSRGDVDYTILTSPNNPTGDTAPLALVREMLEASDALVVVDEAYCEFSGETAAGLLARYENLAILRTFSKAYRLAGARVGYVLANEPVISALKKVRQPYSIDAVAQAIACAVMRHRAEFAAGVEAVRAQRDRLVCELGRLPDVRVWPSSANFVLMRIEGESGRASAVWEALLERGVLVRDFSATPQLDNCLRVTAGTAAETGRAIDALRDILGR